MATGCLRKAGRSNAKRLKELETENNRLKRLLAEAHLDIEALKVGFGVKR